MSLIEMPAVLARGARKESGRGKALAHRWIAPALAVLFAVVAVVLASSLSVVTNLI